MRARAPVWLLVVGALAAGAGPALTQGPPNGLLTTRDSLRSLVVRAESEALPALAAALRRRLEQGDFHPGDRIILRVEGEATLSDTFQVTPAVELLLPAVGAVPLRGVLHAELEAVLAGYVGRVIRDPVVRVRSTISLAVFGEVARPGFYAVPVDGLLGDVVMAAGGPTREAKMAEMRVERGERPLLVGQGLARAIAQRRSVADAGLEPGDRLFIPSRNQGRFVDTLRSVAIILSIPAAIAGLAGVF